MKNKLDSVMARVDGLCSEEGGDDRLWGDTEHKRWAKLFKWVAAIDSNHDCTNSLPAPLGWLRITAPCSIIVSAPRDTRNVKVTSWLCPEWQKISGTRSSSTKCVATNPTRRLCSTEAGMVP